MPNEDTSVHSEYSSKLKSQINKVNNRKHYITLEIENQKSEMFEDLETLPTRAFPSRTAKTLDCPITWKFVFKNWGKKPKNCVSSQHGFLSNRHNIYK